MCTIFDPSMGHHDPRRVQRGRTLSQAPSSSTLRTLIQCEEHLRILGRFADRLPTCRSVDMPACRCAMCRRADVPTGRRPRRQRRAGTLTASDRADRPRSRGGRRPRTLTASDRADRPRSRGGRRPRTPTASDCAGSRRGRRPRRAHTLTTGDAPTAPSATLTSGDRARSRQCAERTRSRRGRGAHTRRQPTARGRTLPHSSAAECAQRTQIGRAHV